MRPLIDNPDGALLPLDADALVEAGRLAALGELVRGSAHEINNPLFAVLALVDFVLADVEPGTKAHERLLLVAESAKEIQAVVDRLHRFSREVETGPAEIALERVSGDAADLLRRVSGSRDVELVERYPGEPVVVRGDAARLKLVFVTLLLHAFRGLPHGGTVVVEVAREDDGARASVAWEGSPASPQHTGAPASDLGIAAAREIVERHGGTLAADGAERLVLRLPEAA